MTRIEQKVAKARSRLWINRWFSVTAWTGTIGLGVFCLFVLIIRMLGTNAPLDIIAACTGGAILIIGTIWSFAGRATPFEAATELDKAAGLKERISSSLHCVESEDPYARAVQVDAERISDAITVQQHLPLQAPRHLWYTGCAGIALVISLLLPSGWLPESEAREKNDIVKRQTVEVKKEIDALKQSIAKNQDTEENPALKELVASLEQMKAAPMKDPEATAREAIKKIDRAADAMRERLGDRKYDKVNETKKMMSGIKMPDGPETKASKLAKALASGDFKAANEQINAMQKELAKMDKANKTEAQQQMQKQLQQLSQQLNKVANQQKQMQQQLQKSGMSQQQAQKLAQQLAQGNTSQLQKAMQNTNLSQQQKQQLQQQLQKQSSACQACRNMSQALQQAAQSMQQGQGGSASQNMQNAGDQLSNMETLEQEMNQLQSNLNNLQQAQNNLDGCRDGKCGGNQQMAQGGKGNKKGKGTGGKGQGKGGVVSEETTAVAFKAERTPVFTGEGRIIGQFLFTGEQVKGEAQSKLVEIVTAEQSNATDQIDRNRLPRQYQRSVKEYFSRVQKILGNDTTVEKSEDSSNTDESTTSENSQESEN